MAETKFDPPPEDDAARDRRVYLEMIDELHASTARTVAGLVADNARVVAENWRLIQEKAEREAPQWLTLKRAAGLVEIEYENVRYWCEQGVIVAEKRGGRWFVRMDSLQAHVAALRGK
jgi:hypothetical protein